MISNTLRLFITRKIIDDIAHIQCKNISGKLFLTWYFMTVYKHGRVSCELKCKWLLCAMMICLLKGIHLYFSISIFKGMKDQEEDICVRDINGN